MKTQFQKHIYSFLFIIYSIATFAQPGDIDEHPADDDPSAPIDSWIILLLIAGLFFAFYIIKKNRCVSINK